MALVCQLTANYPAESPKSTYQSKAPFPAGLSC